MNYLRREKLGVMLAGAILVAACGGDSGTSVEAPDALGSYAVGHTMFTSVDAAREDRELIVNVWYPVDPADAATEPRTEYPLQDVFSLPSEVAVDDLPVSSEEPLAFLVFSHGFGAINTQSTPLMEALASHGFIVASPEHTGNTALDASDDHATAAAKRVPDVSHIIDTMFERARTQGDAFEGRIDESKVGVLGHSFGGSTAFGMVAGWAGADPDPRVKAIGSIAGGMDSDDFSEEVLETVTEPTILLVGTLDPLLENHNYVFDHMPNAEAIFKVEVTGANHTHFANICAIGDFLIDVIMLPQENWPGVGAEALIQPYNDTCTDDVFPIAEAQRLQNLYMVAHFKRYLLGQTGYDRFLSATHAEANEPAVSFVMK